MIGFLEEAALHMDLKQGSNMAYSAGKQHCKMDIFKFLTWTN